MSQLVSVRKVANNGLQAELYDKVQKPGRLNVLAALNVGDERFTNGSPRRAWFPVTLKSLELMGVPAKKLEEIENAGQDDRVEIYLENPTIAGEVLRIQITESVVGDAWQRENVTKAAKQISIDAKVAGNKSLRSSFDLGKYLGQIAYFLDKDGNYIFSRGTVTVESQLNHTFIEHGDLVPETEMGSFGATLADPVRVEIPAEAENVRF
jgi:hypothetical protein